MIDFIYIIGAIFSIIGVFLAIYFYLKSRESKKNKEHRSKLPNIFVPTIINRDIPKERKNQINSFLDFVENLLMNDQIKETGAWGYLQRNILNLQDEKITEREYQEGGIISTFIAIRALKYRKNLNNNSQEFKSALKYLLERQYGNGGFGRKYYSRSGSEIKPSFRHTALSIIQLILLDGPPNKISEAVDYLKTYTLKDITSDASPSLAISTLLLVLEILINEPYIKYLNTSQIKELEAIYKRDKGPLLNHLISESKNITNEYSPYFIPYGRTKEMLYDTALTIIDFLSCISNPPLDVIINILNQIRLECANLKAIPYYRDFTTLDIGMSIYYYVLCNREIIKNAIEKEPFGFEIMSFVNKSMDFVIDNYKTKKFSKYTYTDTVGNALLLNFRTD